MTAKELALWAEANERSGQLARMIRAPFPCSDCTREFALKARRLGLCDRRAGFEDGQSARGGET